MVAAPMTNLTWQGVDFRMAFRTLKAALVSAPVLV